MTPENASFRDHPLRKAQKLIEGQIPGIINYLHNHGYLAGTQLEQTLESGQQLMPDDLTLAGLEFTVKAARAQVKSGLNLNLLGRFSLGGLMDGLDGAHARHLQMSSPDGAVKDVLADRTSELFIARIITENRSKYFNCPPKLEQNLTVAFQLSTLIKAVCEMSGVKTSEGGAGSMLERRQQLFLTLLDIGKLNHDSGRGQLKPVTERKLLGAIDSRNQVLITNSIQRAKGRIEDIKHHQTTGKIILDHQALDNPASSAAVEARKYAIVVEMNRRTSKVDMIEIINSLSGSLEFPTTEELITKYPYINLSLQATQPFLEKSLSILENNPV